MNFDLDFYKGKKVFVTGHTGFKGSWLCKMLVNAGAIVTGYSLKIDWSKVDVRLNLEKEKSYKFLRSVVDLIEK